MARNLSPKCKICRRVNQKLFLRGERCLTSKCALLRKPYPPGAHKRTQKLTEYGKQLTEKQKVKRIYGVLENQFRNYVRKAIAKAGDSRGNLFKLLEARLDNIVIQCGIVSSRNAARQVVRHGHIEVNNQKVDIPSFQVKVGDIITFSEKFKKTKLFENNKIMLGKKEVPVWLSLDLDKMIIKVVDWPKTEESIDLLSSLGTVIDFYSR